MFCGNMMKFLVDQLRAQGRHSTPPGTAAFWCHPDGSAEAVDPTTVVVNTRDPWISIRALELLRRVGEGWTISISFGPL